MTDVLQASKFFNQLNIYSPESNRWTQVVTDNCPDGIAGHGATIVNDTMVVFGGYHGHGNRSVVPQCKMCSALLTPFNVVHYLVYDSSDVLVSEV